MPVFRDGIAALDRRQRASGGSVATAAGRHHHCSPGRPPLGPPGKKLLASPQMSAPKGVAMHHTGAEMFLPQGIYVLYPPLERLLSEEGAENAPSTSRSCSRIFPVVEFPGNARNEDRPEVLGLECRAGPLSERNELSTPEGDWLSKS